MTTNLAGKAVTAGGDREREKRRTTAATGLSTARTGGGGGQHLLDLAQMVGHVPPREKVRRSHGGDGEQRERKRRNRGRHSGYCSKLLLFNYFLITRVNNYFLIFIFA